MEPCFTMMGDELREIGRRGAERLFTVLIDAEPVQEQIRAARDEVSRDLAAYLHARGCGPDDVDAAWPIVWAEFDERWTYLTSHFAAASPAPH